MGKEHLKNLNATPIAKLNTLDRPAGLTTHRSSDRRPAKRSRRDSVLGSTIHLSRHFPATQRSRQEDSIQDGSLEEPFEIKSQSSAGNVSQVPVMVPEPREVMVGNKRLKRKQKAGLFIAQDRHFATASTSLGSPDVLAVDDPDDPPPTDIGSDIPSSHFHGRRGRPISHVELPSKRQRRGSITIEDIQDSEDELAHTGPGVGATVNLKRRRLTNFDSIQTREGKRHSIPNTDIIPTDFRSPKKSDDQRKASQVFNLIGAITGKQIWESSSYEQAALVLEGTKFFRFFVNGQLVKESPFEIELNTIRKLNHAMTDSPFVALQRRSSFGQSPQMYLHFETQLDATRFMQCISFGQSSVQESDPQLLEKQFQHSREIARDYQRRIDVTDRIAQTNIRNIVQTPSSQTIFQDHAEDTEAAQGELKGEGSERPRREKLVEKLARSAADTNATCQDLTEAPDNISSTGKSSRSGTAAYRTRRSSPRIDVSEDVRLDRWTHENPGWQSQWKKSLVYPATGKNRATVDADDIARLDEGEFLNDNLISFYLRYLQAELERERPEVLEKVYIFSSFFYEKLKSATKYEGVKSWTAKIDLFSYDYIIVPVNEHAHWYLAIICNVGQTLTKSQPADQDEDTLQNGETTDKLSHESPSLPGQVQTVPTRDELGSPRPVRISDEIISPSSVLPPEQLRSRRSIGGSSSKVDAKAPKIITLDSLDGSHSGTCKTLKTYLENEAQDKKGLELAFVPGGMKGKDIPHQDNFCDCGVFVLGYMEEFLKDPDEAASCLLQKEKLNWSIKPQHLRNKIRALLFDLQKEQHGRLAEEKASKKAKRLQKKETVATVSDASHNSCVSQSYAPSSDPIVSKPSTPDSGEATTLTENPAKENVALYEKSPKQSANVNAELALGIDTFSVSKEAIKSPSPAPRSLVKTGSPRSPINYSVSLASLLKGSSSEASGDAFYSAPSSPSDSTRLRTKPPFSAGDLIDGKHSVRLLAGSESEFSGTSIAESTGTTTSKKRKKRKGNRKRPREAPKLDHRIQPSVEKDSEEHMFGTRLHSPIPEVSESEPAAERVVSSYFALAPATQKLSPTTQSPQYEGIQRSIE